MNETPSFPGHHTRDLGKGRFSKPGRTYLITTVVHGRRPLFSDWQIGRVLVSELRGAERLGFAQSLAFVIMPDHLHWLVTLQSGNLPALMQRIKGHSAIAINRTLDSPRQVWQRGFHDHALREEEHLQAVARYIVANPLREGLVKKIGNYPLWDAIWL